jgi:hypothetical protein
MIPLMLASLAAQPIVMERIPHVPLESLPAAAISCELRTLDFADTVRLSFRQSGGRIINAEHPGFPARTPVRIDVLTDDTHVLEKSLAPNETPDWFGFQPFRLGGSFRYLRFQPVPAGGWPVSPIGHNDPVAYVVDVVLVPQGVVQLVGRCTVRATKQAPLSPAERKELLQK